MITRGRCRQPHEEPCFKTTQFMEAPLSTLSLSLISNPFQLLYKEVGFIGGGVKTHELGKVVSWSKLMMEASLEGCQEYLCVCVCVASLRVLSWYTLTTLYLTERAYVLFPTIINTSLYLETNCSFSSSLANLFLLMAEGGR